MSEDDRVTRAALRRDLHPISAPEPLSRLPQRIWTDADWERIQRGYRSRDMDERWDVFAEGEEVFLHRSWTGFGVFAATFAPAAEGGWRITRAVVERDPERYRGRNEDDDCLMLEWVLSAIVLGEPASGLRARMADAARRRPGSADAPPGLVQHSMPGLRSDP